MKCEECDGLITVEANAVRRYDIGGLPHVELHGVEVSRCAACGQEGIAIPRIAQLHRVLADYFIKQPRMLAPVEIRFLRKHVGFSTLAFAKTMGVSRETVSRWETGKTPMGTAADRLLRMIVLQKEPIDDYAVEDMLQEIADGPAPRRPSRLSMRVTKDGWRPDRPKLASI